MYKVCHEKTRNIPICFKNKQKRTNLWTDIEKTTKQNNKKMPRKT